MFTLNYSFLFFFPKTIICYQNGFRTSGQSFFLSWNVISESDGGEGDEDEVDGVDEVPLRLGEREGDRGDDDEGDDENPRHGHQVDQPLEFGYDWGQIVQCGPIVYRYGPIVY